MMRVLLLSIAMIALPTVALADPCEGRLPTRAGESFGGIVQYVGDGDSLCVGRTTDPREWVEVRLADYDAPELQEREGRRAKDMLSRLVRGRLVDCTAVRGRSGRVTSHDRVIASCRINGRRLGELLRSHGAPRGGN